MRKGLLRSVFFIGALGMGLFWRTFPVHADTLTVQEDCEAGSTTCFESIQDAINAAWPNWTINIEEGTYIEDVVIGSGVTVNINGDGDNTVIETAGGVGIQVRSPETEISNLKVLSSVPGSGIGVEVLGDGVEVSNCYFEGLDIGVLQTSVGDEDLPNQISSNEFEDNNTAIQVEGDSGETDVNGNWIEAGSGTEVGINITGNSEYITVENNDIYKVGTGILMNSSNTDVWKQNIVDSNLVEESGLGIDVQTGVPWLKNNQLLENETGLKLSGGEPVFSSSNTIENNEDYGVEISGSDQSVVGLEVQENNAGILVTGNGVVLYDITVEGNDNLGVELRGDDIEVRDSNIKNNGLDIYCNGAGNFWLEKTSLGGEDSDTAVLVDNGSTGDFLSNGIGATTGYGFHLVNGTVDFYNNEVARVEGPGVYVEGGTIEHMGLLGLGNFIHDNEIGVEVDGGNINSLAYSTIEDNGNDGIVLADGNLTVTRSRIESNGENGILAEGGNLRVEYSQVEQNTDHGLNLNGGSGDIEDNLIRDNEGTGAFVNTGGYDLVRNEFASNTDYGLEVRSDGNNIEHNIFVDNNDDLAAEDQIDNTGSSNWNENYFQRVQDSDLDEDGIADDATVVVGSADNNPLITSGYIDSSFHGGTYAKRMLIPYKVPTLVHKGPDDAQRDIKVFYAYSYDSGGAWSAWQDGDDVSLKKEGDLIEFTAPETEPSPGEDMLYRFVVLGIDNTHNNWENLPDVDDYEAEVEVDDSIDPSHTPSYTDTPSNTPTNTPSDTPSKTFTPTGTYATPIYKSPTDTRTFTPTPEDWELTKTITPGAGDPDGAAAPPSGGYDGGGGGGGGGSSYRTNTPSSDDTSTPTPTYDVRTDTKPDNTKNPKDFYALDHEAQWIAQYQASAYEGGDHDGDEYFDVGRCGIVNFWAELKNVGDLPWLNSNHAYATNRNEFTFSTYKDPNVRSAPAWTGYDNCPEGPHCGKSYFWHNSWVSVYRIGTLEQEIVKSGEIGKVNMTFQVPCDADYGRYREDISAASGDYWVYNGYNGDPLDVMHIWVGFDVQ